MEEKILKRNTPHDAWPKEGIQRFYVRKGGRITFMNTDHMGGGLECSEDYVILPISSKKTLYDGRYCAVSGFVFTYIEGNWYVLANKRGDGAPDYKHCWNVVCGFLEADETDRQGISREVAEETGYVISPDMWEFQGVETDPKVCNNGNVSLRFTAIVDAKKLESCSPEGGELAEVEDCDWIRIDYLDDYKWAFNHRELIPEMFSKLSWKDKITAKIKFWFFN